MSDDSTRVRYGLMTPDGFVEQPHWEHGYRCHGYWLGNKRLGAVSLGPLGRWNGVYRWHIDGTRPEVGGEARTLRTAKKRVEEAVVARGRS